MFYKKLYAIYSCDEEYGYVSEVSTFEDSKILLTSKLQPETFRKNEVLLNAAQIANIKLYKDKLTAQMMLEEFALCDNVSNKKNLVVRELDDRELDMIDYCRREVHEQIRGQAFSKYFKNRKLKCSLCENMDTSDMIVGEKNYYVTGKDKPLLHDKRFKKKANVYCNRCGTEIIWKRKKRTKKND